MRSRLRYVVIIGLCVCVLASCMLPALGNTLYVKPTGLDTRSGMSWASAKKTVQAAIDAAGPDTEIWVAAGTYQAITLKNGVSVYGGFASTEALRSQRRPATYVTYLDGGGVSTVVTAPAEATAATVIDGFTIRNGHGASGGGISAANSAITISNNTICDNTALYYGGGIYGESSTLTIISNSLTRNKAPFGGGIACYDSSAPTITGNRIYANTSDYDGSGIYCYSNSTPIIANNLIYSNTASSEGAGVYCDGSSATIVNNTISDNTATVNGGGLACLDSSPIIANNVITFSSSGVRNAGTGLPATRNNIVSGNTAYAYSGIAATSDLTADPSFADRAARDYHIKPGSPAINAGWNSAPGLGTVDIDGGARIQGGAVDIGAFETLNTVGPLVTLVEGRASRRNTYVRFTNVPVSAAFADYFYIENDDRSLGIRVEKSAHGVSQDQRVTVEGVVRTNANWERYVDAGVALPSGASDVKPLYMHNDAVGGADWCFDAGLGTGQSGVSLTGVNNIGLLVRVAGRFHYDAPDRFTINDGTTIVKCITTPGVELQQTWGFAAVTGVSSCELVVSQLTSLIRVRSQSDIQAF